MSLRGKRSDEAISREGGFPQDIYFFTSVVGHFAFAQYDVKKTIVGVADDSGMQIQRFRLVAKALYKFYLYIARRGGRN